MPNKQTKTGCLKKQQQFMTSTSDFDKDTADIDFVLNTKDRLVLQV